MKLIKKNILHILNSKIDTSSENPFTADEIISILSDKKTGRITKDEIINILSTDGDFYCNLTVDKIIDALSSKSINGADVIDVLAKTSSLTEEQVKEVFVTFRDFIDKIIDNSYTQNIDIMIPYFGKIKMKYKKGRKAGTDYYIPYRDTEDNHRVVTEDEPSYLRFFVEVKPEIQSKLKEVSMKRLNKKSYPEWLLDKYLGDKQ